MIEDKVDKLQNRFEGNQEAELDDAHASDVSEFYTLEEFEELNYKAMTHRKKVQEHQIQMESQLQIKGYSL